MYGQVTGFIFDTNGWPAPVPGDEWKVTSPAGRSVRGYVVQSAWKVKSPVRDDRYRCRVMHVPIEQLEAPLPVQRN